MNQIARRIPIFVTIAIVFLFSGCSLWDRVTGVKALELTTTTGKVKVKIEVADTEEKRSKGLMKKEELKEGHGMWFVFEKEEPRYFWMKNTLIPLDIIFADKDKMVVSFVENMVPCKEEKPENCQRYPSEKAAMFALEVPVGFIKQHAIAVGDKIEE